MRPSFGRLALAIAAALLPLAAAAQDQAADCAAPTELVEDDPQLPLVADALRQHQPVTIVAIGGLSTAGTAVQSPSLAYPERLKVELLRRHPDAQISVVNRGVPHQTAQEMVDRFDRDVIAENPVLAIWETGTTEAVGSLDVEAFGTTLEGGIAALRDHHIEVMLINMQYSRRTASIIGFDRYLEAMQRVADLSGVYLFRRFEIMKFWSDNGTFNFEDVPKSERAALAARVYDCLAHRLADAIDHAVR